MHFHDFQYEKDTQWSDNCPSVSQLRSTISLSVLLILLKYIRTSICWTFILFWFPLHITNIVAFNTLEFIPSWVKLRYMQMLKWSQKRRPKRHPRFHFQLNCQERRSWLSVLFLFETSSIVDIPLDCLFYEYSTRNGHTVLNSQAKYSKNGKFTNKICAFQIYCTHTTIILQHLLIIDGI